MKTPLIVASLILPALALTACKPALIPPVAQGGIHVVAEAEWKRNPAALPSVADGPATGISLESTDSLKGAGQRPAKSSGGAGTGSQSDDSPNTTADSAQQNKSQLSRKILALQLLQSLSGARP